MSMRITLAIVFPRIARVTRIRIDWNLRFFLRQAFEEAVICLEEQILHFLVSAPCTFEDAMRK
jgi:hypothetical protein